MRRASRCPSGCWIGLASAMSVVSCARSSQSTPAPSTTTSATTVTSATASTTTDGGTPTRMHLRVDRCLPVGYGLACGADVVVDGAPPQPAHIESCIGSNEVTDFYTRLSQAPIVGNDAGAPIAFWVDAVPAPESARYCGVIVIHATAHWRVVAVQP